MLHKTLPNHPSLSKKDLYSLYGDFSLSPLTDGEGKEESHGESHCVKHGQAEEGLLCCQPHPSE